MSSTWNLIALGTCLWMSSVPAIAATEKLVEVDSRGQKIRALLITPDKPIGSVVLLAGDTGRLDLTSSGSIGANADNELVRSRGAYAAAGYVTLVTDLAPDLKTANGVVAGYRGGSENAADIGADVKYVRGIAAPVILIGTSRGTISAANAAVRLSGQARPDAVVLSSAFLGANPNDFTVQKLAGSDPKRLDLPMLIIEHRNDVCPYTAPAAIPSFQAWYETAGRKLDLVWLEGGTPPQGDPCQARAAHGFPGLDSQLVSATVAWMKNLAPSP